MKKEFYIFLVILIFLSALMHLEEFISYPLEHLLALKTSAAYGFGFLHPFVFTFVIYILFLIPRLVVKFIKNRKNNKNF